MKFTEFINQNHPDPDSLFNEKFDEICRLAENYAINKQLLNNEGLPCKCGNKTYTHRHSNWIECTSCQRIKILE